MMKTKIAKILMLVMAGSVLMSGSAIAELSIMSKVESTADKAGSTVDSSMKKVGGYINDSSITAKVKAALADNEAIHSTDISVKTHDNIVTLNGFVTSQEQSEQAVAAAKKVEGVVSVSNELQVKDDTQQSVSDYLGDATTTSKVKAKLLADSDVPSRHVEVETTNGVVQLSGMVKTQEQSERAEAIAKAIDGVKSVKNDLIVK